MNDPNSYLSTTTVREVTEMMDGDAEMIIDLIDTLQASMPELLQQLNQGLAQGDCQEVRNAAHALKSSTAQMGADSFAEICKKIEEKAKQHQLQGARDLLPALQREAVWLSQALHDWKMAI